MEIKLFFFGGVCDVFFSVIQFYTSTATCFFIFYTVSELKPGEITSRYNEKGVSSALCAATEI